MQPSMEILYKDVEEIKKEVHEIRQMLTQEPELREDVIEGVKKARQEIKSKFVKHEEIMREFAGQ